MQLPVEIILDILIRLPVDAVLESKLVCKTWRDVIHHPSFSQQHSDRLSSSADDDSGNLGFLFTDSSNSESKQFYYFEYNENNEKPVYSLRRINLTPELKSYTVVGSCNGLICLNKRKSIIICNPITREYVDLPMSYHHFFCYGFGYLVSTNEYKVVRMCGLELNSIEIEVYTLGSGKGWRNVGELKYKISSLYDEEGVFANGAIHWWVYGERMIVAFDLADEKFREIPLPILDQGSIRRAYLKIVGTFGDYLMCRDYQSVGNGRFLDIWLLKGNSIHDMNGEVDYKSMRLSEEFDVWDVEPFAVTNSGGVLCLKAGHSNPTLHRYDLKSSSLEMLVSFDKQKIHPLFAYMKTLASLKALGEGNTKRMESSLETERSD